jgi:hypothetical protein
VLSTIDIDEFTRMVGLDLSTRQAVDLAEMLQVQSETGKWRWPEWSMTEDAPDLLAARALFGLLVLNEDVLWTAPLRNELRDAFHRVAHAVSQLGTPTETSNVLDLEGAPVKIRRANGEEGLERLDSRKRITFVCHRYRGSARGHSADLLILGDRAHLDDVLPTMAARRNPQVIYA